MAIDPWKLPTPPVDEAQNLKYRAFLRQMGDTNLDYRQAIKKRCQLDPIFWFNAFCWTKDPKWRTGMQEVPIVLYPGLQDNLVLAQRRCWDEGRSMNVPKTREQGLSVITMYNLQHAWQFENRGSALIGSLKADNVDGKGWATCLFPKLDFNLERQPSWLLPVGFDMKSKTCVKYMYRCNPETGNCLLGEPTNINFSRSGRFFAIMVDEAGVIGILSDILEATGNASRSTMLIGTPKGRNTFCTVSMGSPQIMLGESDRQWKDIEFTDPMKHPAWDGKGALTFWVHWTMNSAWRAGFYYCEPGCKAHPLGGKPHSTRYDQECESYRWNPVTIAQELDGDFGKSGNAVFEVEMIEKCRKRVQERLDEGSLDLTYYRLFWDGQPKRIDIDAGDMNAWYRASREWGIRAEKSPQQTTLRVWKTPRWCKDRKCLCGGTGKHTYCVGSDIAKGLEEGDASCAYVLDATVGEIVAELHARCDPQDFAIQLMQLVKWYGKASGMPTHPYTTIEWNDQGLIVNKICESMGLGAAQHVYTSEDRTRGAKGARKLGNVVQVMNRGRLLDEYAAAYVSKDNGHGWPLLIVPFPEFWDECMNMIRKNPGVNETIGAERPRVGKTSKSHDDRVWALVHCINGACIRHNNRVKNVIRRDVNPTGSKQIGNSTILSA